MSYSQQPIYATTSSLPLAPAVEQMTPLAAPVPLTQPAVTQASASLIQTSQPAIIPHAQPVMLPQPFQSVNYSFGRARVFQANQPALIATSQPIAHASNLVLNTQNDDLFSVSLPKPINYSNLNQITNVTPVIVKNRPTISNRIVPVAESNGQEQDKQIKNNIKIQIDNNHPPHRGHKRNICLGVLIGVLITILIVIIGVITLAILRKKIPNILDNLVTTTKTTRLKASCISGYFGTDCSSKCNLTNSISQTVPINFKYKTEQLIDNNRVAITERRVLTGLVLDETSILIAKSNLISDFTYMYNSIQHTAQVVPNQFFPTYESMFSVILDSAGSFSGHSFRFEPNVALITRGNSTTDLAVLKLQSGSKLIISDFNLNCFVFFQSSLPSNNLGFSWAVFYANLDWIRQQI